MRENFTRTISKTVIKSAMITFVEGVVVTTPCVDITEHAKISDNDKALAIVKSTYGKKGTYVVTGLEVTDTTYAISIEDFMKYAKVVEPKAPKE